jgi:para-nitrobenzyl esterase
MRPIAILALACAGWAGAASSEPLEARVHTANGWVEGEQGAGQLKIFRGIRYAAPPVGDLRWRPPAAPASWSGVRDARHFSPDCPQSDPVDIRRQAEWTPPQAQGQSEDCLSLNIWTAAQRSDERLPVMVWIYGGGFQTGSGARPEYDGETFARAGVVLVTINYRVGVLGFLVHSGLTAESSYHSSGNYGLLDQIAALQWVKRNIAAFGGDPDHVTIFGESAGSTAVNILQASPLAHDLFARVIGESTSQMDAAAGLLGRQSLQQAENYGRAYGDSLGANSVEELRKLPVERLLAAAKPFWPLDPDGYVLPTEVYATFAAGQQNDVPTLVGSNASEGLNLKVPWITPQSQAEKAAFRKLYPNAGDPQIYSDTVAWQMRSWAALQSRTGHRPSFLYLFDQSPPPSDLYPPGPIHAAEIVYVFQSFDHEQRAWTSVDRQLGKLMSQYWINFARTGDPNGAGLPSWPAFHSNDAQVMNFAADSHAEPAPHQEAFAQIDAYLARRRPAAPQILNIDLSHNGPDLAASVPDIALDPRDQENVAVVWRFVAIAKDTGQPQPPSWGCHLSLSTDGGSHFSDTAIHWGMPDTPRCNAPWVDWSPRGVLYIGATLAAASVKPDFGRAVVRRSSDDEHSWSKTIDAIGSDTQARFAPNPAISEEARRTPWDGARGVVDAATGDLYVSGAYPAAPGGAAHSQRFYSVSKDGGRTWGLIRAYGSLEWPQRWDSHLVAAHGELALAYIADAVPQEGVRCPCVVFATSHDAGMTLERKFVAGVVQLDTLVHYPPIAADPRVSGVFTLALVSEDGSTVRVLSTRDDGAHWKEARVGQPPRIARVSRPALAYAPDGTLVLMWRGVHPDESFDIYVIGGADADHLRTPVRLSTATSHVPQALVAHYAVRGDFLNVAAADARFVHAVWTDWRTGTEARVYYGRVSLERLLAARGSGTAAP